LLDRLKALIGGSGSGRAAADDRTNNHTHHQLPDPFARQSNGLEQFFSSLRDRPSLNILDFAGASQANVSFITSMGHRLASQDFVRALELTFGDKDLFENQSDPQRLDQFVMENLNFTADEFDGALVWDGLQFLSPHLLQIAVDRLHETLRPDAYLLAFFYADERARELPLYSYRIGNERTLQLAPRGFRKPAQVFNNRALEKLFHRFQSVKFFLARDSLREIIVRR
jgi:hypothetical protein